MKGTVISLYDYTGMAVRPWAEKGFDCLCFDVQHENEMKVEKFEGGGSISYIKRDLYLRENLSEIVRMHIGRAVFLMAFPPCTDLAVSGAMHFKPKREKSPLFQEIACDHAIWAAKVGEALGVPYMIENPVSVLATYWRKSDYGFDPFQYGGYLPEDEHAHPSWPEYIAPRDAYPKHTRLWTGGGFIMPEPKPVHCPKGYSAQHKKLGGKSMKTKNIRSATPRGFARAVCEANCAHLKVRADD